MIELQLKEEPFKTQPLRNVGSYLSLLVGDESSQEFLFENLNIVRDTQLSELPELSEVAELPISRKLKTNNDDDGDRRH